MKKLNRNKITNNIIFISLTVFLFVLFSTSFVLANEKKSNIINANIQKNVPGKDVVVFNVQNKKMHKPGCEWADKCTKNCVYISKKEALKRGGIPCKVCGGPDLTNEDK